MTASTLLSSSREATRTALDTLRAVNVPVAYDDRRGFYRDGRREVFRHAAMEQGYALVEDNRHFLLLSRGRPDPGMEYVLVSAHADSIYRRDEDFICETFNRNGVDWIRATLDNSAGLAAALHMLERVLLPDNAILALTAEEPPHSFAGARMVSEYIRLHSIPIKGALVLDVIYDERGYSLSFEKNERNVAPTNTLWNAFGREKIRAFPAAPTGADEGVVYKRSFPAMLIGCPVHGQWHGRSNSITLDRFSDFLRGTAVAVGVLSDIPLWWLPDH